MVENFSTFKMLCVLPFPTKREAIFSFAFKKSRKSLLARKMFKIKLLWYINTGGQAGPPKGPPCKEHWMSFSIRSTSISRTWFENFGSKMWLEQIYFIFPPSCLLKRLFLSKGVFGNFSRSGLLTKWEKFSFSSLWSFTTLKSHYFCQKMDLNSFCQAAFEKMSKVCIFKFLKPQSVQNPLLLSKVVFE